MDNSQVEKNKHVINLLWEHVMTPVHEGRTPDVSKLDGLVHENYIEHNGLGASGLKGARDFLLNMLPSVEEHSPFSSPLVAVNLIGEGDMVFRQEIRKDWILVDVFRLEDGLVMEHWEAWHFGPNFPRPPFMKN